ncbi:regulator of chromosome condensation 1/beta-lactamase-inhibitor protein II [Chaetomium fimeti]|uniref:Regulator of chromosome condensation 1/beta-lactamase-inhibitor protein II n=1 Tax=Chaetomium fimeti TaxID=1854472 RepID=A0AAE0LPX0_9PEZI|nr:regulator of chromosome condensation 1/beta-lactamase-inhibitor protein II [Chaetomium fimeti]
MVLYATGFNAWNQLQFETPGVDEPDDISSFTCVLQGDDDDCIRPFFSYTRAHDGKDTFNQYPSINALLSNNDQPHRFSDFPNITQLVAYEAGFAALSSTGNVWTWGDERYTACLGREPTASSPAERPGLVSDLDDLPTGPITKIAAGGYVLAALTAGNDLYCWGHAGRSTMLDDLSDDPNPVVIDDKDILDVAVGESHMLVLTTDAEVYVVGDNTNGQLGLPGTDSTTSWTRIDLASVLGAGETVTGVVAGPRNSFLIAQRQSGECQ